ncbi:zinc metalloprotease HtpX [Haloarchaeobius iranensis]|uniref:Protease HtpX homolog n=1 Tax=Haloarchaeobius iranensis TaxID=996166 RepID=A0A1G9S9L1_9EURY|nr:zinc metalloprotease HtpX [Haloarchaeobius iranensis]SDM32159.1 Heat shock protein. Metallo peptidase. MEROPS family M48B [Haloarchaeobius iranensis]
MQWKADWGLRLRMFVTMFLLTAVYLIFIGALSVYLGIGFTGIVLMFALFSGAQWFFSDKLTLWSMGAKEVSEDEYPELHGMVRRLSQQADVPTPKVAVVDSQVPNAFATGRSQKHSAVAVTTGLMRTLNREELEGVIAHELAHVKNRDVMVMTIASFLSTIAFLVVRFGFFFGGGRDRNNGGVFVAIAVSLVVWVISYLLIRALSRYREFAADRGAAVITGKPAALASALNSISGGMDRAPKEDMREQAEMNAFFIFPVSGGTITRLFSTHPSMERRIERLQQLEREMEAT